MTGHHTRWVRPETEADDLERLAIRESLAFGKALYDRRTALGLSVTDLAGRADMTSDEIECIEEGDIEHPLNMPNAGPVHLRVARRGPDDDAGLPGR